MGLLGNKEVTTIGGKKALKSDCRKIGNDYYLIGDNSVPDSGECYYINDKYYKYNTGYIEYDYRIKSYTTSKAELLLGVVGFGKDGGIIKGKFSSVDGVFAEFNKISVTEGLFYLLEGIKIPFNYYKLNLTDNIYYANNQIAALRTIEPPKTVISRSIKNSLSYDSRNSLSSAIAEFNKRYKKTDFSNVSTIIDKLLHDLSFGVEFETVKGSIPFDTCKNVGLIPLRDGSIEGLEYATIPLSGRRGIDALSDSIDLLKNNTTYDKNCSIHFHIGNLPRTEEFFVALFKILCIIQQEMFDMFPIYKQFNRGFKRKHYTKPFDLVRHFSILDNKMGSAKDVKKNFAKLYKFLSMGEDYMNDSIKGKLSNIKYHPSDPGGNSKWNIRTRYYWCNLIPLLFGNKETVEFRLHTPTYNKNKIFSYLILICNIIEYVKRNSSYIVKDDSNYLNLSLADILFNNTNSASTASMIDKKGYRFIENIVYYISTRTRTINNNFAEGNVDCPEEKIRNTFNFGFKQSKGINFADRNFKINSLNPLRKTKKSIEDFDVARMAVAREIRNRRG